MSNNAYIDIIKPKYLTRAFLEPFITQQPPFGQLGAIVYLRTYSRYIEQLKRRERYWETCMRVVEYSMSLLNQSPKYLSSNRGLNVTVHLQKEAEDLFELFFYMKAFPSGRTMFVGGSEASELYPSSNFNCSGTVIKNTKAFVDAMYLLMLGCGVGYSVEKKYVSNLPLFNRGIELIHQPYIGVVATARTDKTSNSYTKNNKTLTIIVGDSKDGWVEALRVFLDAYTYKHPHFPDEIHRIVFVYDHVRPAGERLKTFGGRASGYLPLQQMFQEVHNIIETTDPKFYLSDYWYVQDIRNKKITRLSSVSAMDIMNSIAKSIVVGGVRRSAQISLGDVNDKEFVEAKLNLFTDDCKAKFRTTRVLSNNSVHLWKKPSRKEFHKLFEPIKSNGEPGLYIGSNAAKRRPNYAVTNPCSEILLANQGVCNLVTLNMASFVEDGVFQLEEAKKAIRLITRVSSRQTLVTMFDEEWDYVQKRDRLLGVSLTGIVDAQLSLLPFLQDGLPFYVSELRRAARNEATAYHQLLGIKPAVLVTTIKPEGSLSQIPTVSSGIHAPYSPYYIRRIRVSKSDPIASALRSIGFEATPENNQGDDLFADECTSWVFQFHVKTNAKMRSIDEPALVQLERYKMMMREYCDHNVSITVSVAEDEWDAVEDWVYENWDYCIGIAFLPKFDPALADCAYPQPPYETITAEQYHPQYIDEEKLVEQIALIEKTYEEYDLDADCGSKGFCPIR